MLCGSCGTENVDGRSFCGECGKALSLACPACNAPNRAGEKYCGACGKSLPENSAASAAPQAAQSPSSKRPLPETIARGRYRVRRMLGEGGSKIVYLAHDEMLDRDVAVSLFRVLGFDEG